MAAGSVSGDCRQCARNPADNLREDPRGPGPSGASESRQGARVRRRRKLTPQRLLLRRPWRSLRLRNEPARLRNVLLKIAFQKRNLLLRIRLLRIRRDRVRIRVLLSVVPDARSGSRYAWHFSERRL